MNSYPKTLLLFLPAKEDKIGNQQHKNWIRLLLFLYRVQRQGFSNSRGRVGTRGVHLARLTHDVFEHPMKSQEIEKKSFFSKEFVGIHQNAIVPSLVVVHSRWEIPRKPPSGTLLLLLLFFSLKLVDEPLLFVFFLYRRRTGDARGNKLWNTRHTESMVIRVWT